LNKEKYFSVKNEDMEKVKERNLADPLFLMLN